MKVAIPPLPKTLARTGSRAGWAAIWHKINSAGLFVQSPTTLPAFLRHAQDFFHDRTEARGLLVNLFHDLFRFFRRDSGLDPGHFPLPSRIFAFCVVHNLTNWIHNGILNPAE